MHKFLRAVGFSEITKEELNSVFEKVIERPTFQKVAEDSEGNEFAELTKEFGDFFGISLRGTYDENDMFIDLQYMSGVYYQNQTITFGAMINETDKEIAKVKAFVWDSLFGMKSLSNEVEFAN